ncbi:cell division cycle protein 23 homolog [Actinia tenebrosa]|uniref:Cyclosome subunit 8 n=1 Tax=Actinia tenebrosa TaxID=6105 RepID=A0A6P8HHX8_ACTTE|nr:cell division cycle protein 23 homolog [Actinia tenebrosa]
MATVLSFSMAEVKRDLLYAAKECSDRGLVHSSKWSAELACSIPTPTTIELLPKHNHYDTQFTKEYDVFCLGKALFDSKEFERAAFFLAECKSHKALFLRFYSSFLAGEKHKNDDHVDILGPQEIVQNKVLTTLRENLSENHKHLDGFCLYLYGLVLKKLNLKTEALAVLLEAVAKEPLHWGSWLELASLCTDKDMLHSLTLPAHWMKEFFLAHVAIEIQTTEEGLHRYNELAAACFGKSNYVLLQTALANYHSRDFDKAVELFTELQKKDPFSLEQMDTYSNILYVKEMKPELSYLAHHISQIDKYREETCCVIGNYYSLRGQHEKAVMYFQRALKLNPQYTSAWTLMGHEYMELKNPSAAIESYRKAIEVNTRDYRAWYGLGQTYEILKMPSYCLYYYRQAQKLRPNDSRMLVALGDCYEKLEKLQEAKKSYFRAISVGDVEGIAVIKLARLHEQLQEEDDATKYYLRYIEQADIIGVISPEEVCIAYIFMSRYYLKRKKLEDAELYAHKCCEYSESREEGKSLLREISLARSRGEGEADTSDLYQHETSIGHNITSVPPNTMSPSLNPVSPMNLNFNTP